MSQVIEGPRGAKSNELHDVLELVNLVFRTSRNMKPTIQEEFPLLFSKDNVNNLRIIKVNGRVVSHVGIFECKATIYGSQLKVGMIGAVCTHPDYRRLGYATQLVNDAIKKMKEDGIHIVMISGIRRLYDRAGCAIAGFSYDITFTEDDIEKLRKKLNVFNIKLNLDKYHKVNDFIKVYETEPIRYSRPLEHFKILLSSSAWHSAGTYYDRLPILIEVSGEPIAYTIFHIPRIEKEKYSHLVEYAGSRIAILSALSHIIEKYKIKGLTLKVPWWDREMIVLLKENGITLPKTTRINGTIRLLNVEEFIDKIKPYLVERVGEKGEELMIEELPEEKYIIKFKEEKFVEENPKELTWLIFGLPQYVEERFKEFMPKRKFKPSKGELAKLINKAFPFPALPYGLYYT